MRRHAWIILALVSAALLGAAPALAQEQEKQEQQKKETAVEDEALAGTDDLDLLEGVEVEKLVVEALKSETTVQEAPAIITVVTGKQIREQGYRFAGDAVGMVPGFIRNRWMWGTVITNSPRGFTGGGLMMRDGLDVFDIIQGIPVMGAPIPVEMIQRIELISGPGGVLWGANSLLGVMNVVSKTADDLEGVEASAGGGTGPCRPGDFRSYVMGGMKLWGDRIKILAHVSFERYNDAEAEFPFNASVGRYSSPYPQGPLNMSGPMTSDTRGSYLLVASGNAQLGPLSAHWHINYWDASHQANFTGAAMRYTLGEDNIDCTNPANKQLCLNRVDPDRGTRVFGGSYEHWYGLLRYQDRLFSDKLRLDARAFYVHFPMAFKPYVSLIASSLFAKGVVVDQSFAAHRVGGSLDGDITLPWDVRLLFGGEVFRDWQPKNYTNFHTDLATIEMRLPYVCLKEPKENNCPVVVMFDSDRITMGGFVDLQKKLLRNLALEVGGRVQGSAGKRALDPVFLFSGGAVWGFQPNWNLKLNYAQGYRPPPLLRTDANGESINWSGNADLVPEKSQALQGEVNAVLLKGHKALRQLGFRVDYSYTWIENMIQVINGTYKNQGEMGIHSVEFLAEMALKKGHWFTLGYTFIDMGDTVRGKIRTYPNQWFTSQILLNLWNKQLYLSSNLQVRGSAEDPNKYPAVEDAPQNLGNLDDQGQPKLEDTWKARATDIVLDRMPPVALWNAGLRFRLPDQGLVFSFDVYNILNGKFWDSEQGFDPSAYLEFTPVPMEGISFFGSVRYTL